MTEQADQNEVLQSFLQADVADRTAKFGEFNRALKRVAEDKGKDVARAWAKRAVSPLLDYSSLMALRRFLLSSKSEETPGTARRLAILGGPTTIQLRQLIDVFLAGEDIAVEIYEGEYGLFRQEIFAPGSGLGQFRPQVVFLATGARDVLRFPNADMDEKAIGHLLEEEAANWGQLWETANSRWNATLVQNNFEIAPGGVLGHYALRHPAAREHYLDRLNKVLAERAPPYVVLHDLRGLAAEAGSRAWFDPRFYLEFKMPCGPECLVGYAHSFVSLLRAILGRSKKILVLDLDNTIWGGVVGDLGAGGVKVGQGTGESEAFLAFQGYAKELQRRGIVLAVCSKNDDDKAREPFEKREDMILKLSDFACFVANWNNKADNLRTIAERLELKLDSFVFADDNPAERALVRRFVPEVAVPDLPEDPAGYIQAVALHRYFETISFTKEDSARARYYSENSKRRELASRTTDIDSFLASLAMRMKVEPVNELNIERVSQLVNKSNQFNLTTHRFTLAELRELADSPRWRTLTFNLRDSFGDNGLISVILIRTQGNAMAIDTWVMSCRVLQRGVEQFARNELVGLVRKEGYERLLGTYIPTAKNAMVKELYRDLGFEQVEDEDKQTSWSLAITDAIQPLQHYIEREARDE